MAERARGDRTEIEKRRASARARSRSRSASSARAPGNAGKAPGRAAKAGGTGGDGAPAGAPKKGSPRLQAEGSPGVLSRVSPRALILLALLVLFAVLSVSPVTRNIEATTRAAERESELKKERAATESLEREVAEARSLEYVEKEARRQRLVAPGEILYLVTTEGPENEVTYRVKALQSMEEAWARVRQMLHSIPRSQ